MHQNQVHLLARTGALCVEIHWYVFSAILLRFHSAQVHSVTIGKLSKTVKFGTSAYQRPCSISFIFLDSSHFDFKPRGPLRPVSWMKCFRSWGWFRTKAKRSLRPPSGLNQPDAKYILIDRIWLILKISFGKLPKGSSKINRISLNRCPPYTEIFSKRRKIYSVCVESLSMPLKLTETQPAESWIQIRFVSAIVPRCRSIFGIEWRCNWQKSSGKWQFFVERHV